MMLIERAEQLKRQFTDQWVVVKEGIPELRRFSGLTGQVKTVNMNCRILVQFDNPVDISWYDIDPDALTVVDAPLPKKETPKKDVAKSEKKAAPKKSGGMSPLEAARAQGATGAAQPKAKEGLSPLELARQQGTGSAKPAAKSSGGDKPLSPLELARQQGSAGSPPKAEAVAEPAPVAEDPVVEAPAAEASPAEDTSGLSPLELARKQGAFKS